MAEENGLAEYEKSSPQLLSQQPVRLKSEFEDQSANWGDLYSHLESRLGMLRTIRWSWWAHWNRLASLILPYRYRWLAVPNKMDRGKPLNQEIVDCTATDAMQICASGMMSGLMSPSRPWFRLGIALPSVEPDQEARAWLDDTEERIYTILAGSNFYTCMAQAFQDIAVFGTSPVIIYDDFEDIARCYLPACGEYYLAASARQEIDTLYREFTYTVSQLVDFFGLKNCPSQVRSLWETGGASLENEFVVAHAIEPNFPLSDRKGSEFRVLPKHFTWREIYWLKGVRTSAELSRRGFVEKPFMVARWQASNDAAYGRSPGMKALGDIGQLQTETRRKAEFIEKCVRPPMLADPQLENKPASILPGHVTFVNSTGANKGFEPAFVMNPMGLQPLVEDIKEIQNRINRAFYTDIFLLISQMDGIQPRNEMEIAERKGEKIQQLGPVIELFETEFAGPAIQRIWGIMQRRGLLRPMPKSLQNIPLKIDYISMMKMAQRAATTASMERVLAIAGKLGEAALSAQLPNPIRVLDLDEFMREYAEAVNMPARAVRSPSDLAKLDNEKARQMAEQQAWQKGQAAVQGLEGLSRTDVGGGMNAVQALLGTAPSPGEPT